MRVALRPRIENWPFSGYFYGRRQHICWAGRIGAGVDPSADWAEAHRIRARLSSLSNLDGDKKGAIATFLSVLEKERGGGAGEDELTVLVAAWDQSGVAVSGFGLHAIVGMENPGAAEAWLEGDHPLLSLPGWPSAPLGALVVPSAPTWLVGVMNPEDDHWRGRLSGDVLRDSGVRE